MKHRIKNILIGLDQFLWTFLTLGWGSPDETISAAMWRLEVNGSWFAGRMRRFIDWLASPWEEDHCQNSYVSEVLRKQLLLDYMEQKDAC